MNTALAATDEDDFNYSRLVYRTDSVYPRHCAPTYVLERDGLAKGLPHDVLACIRRIWNQFSLPERAVATMSGVLSGLLDHLTRSGLTIHTADDETVLRFAITNPAGHPEPTRSEVNLRVNVINATYLALEDAQVIEPASPLMLPTVEQAAKAGRAYVCSATHDEVLLIRLATRMLQSQRRQHLAAACVAICSSGATAAEAPQVLWRNYAGDQLTLAGRTSLNDRPGMNIATRTINIDPWATTTLNAWRAERSARRPVHDDDSVLYSGNQELTSNSAAVSTDVQVQKALKLAGLAETVGLTAGSFRLWSILKDATDPATAAAAARHGGITLITLHAKVQRLLDHIEA